MVDPRKSKSPGTGGYHYLGKGKKNKIVLKLGQMLLCGEAINFLGGRGKRKTALKRNGNGSSSEDEGREDMRDW